jgi:hypothetical protein
MNVLNGLIVFRLVGIKIPLKAGDLLFAIQCVGNNYFLVFVVASFIVAYCCIPSKIRMFKFTQVTMNNMIS